jgi:hypothetical protein
MTPKEKAQELFDKYATYAVMWTGGIEVEKQNCKMCALIAVDLILTALDAHQWQNRQEINYWNEVKQEIQKL